MSGGIDNAIKYISVLPVVGLAFAFCREGSFYYFLGVDPFQIVQIADLARVSVFYVVPALPLVLIGLWLGANSRQTDDNSAHERTIIPFPKVLWWLLIFSAGTPVILYIFLGFNPPTGQFLLIVTCTIFAFTKIIDLSSLFGGNTKAQSTTYLFLLVCSIFAGQGSMEAMTIRSGDRDELALLVDTENGIQGSNEHSLVRALSGGHLVITNSADQLYFVSNETSAYIQFEVDNEPFRGILCYAFDVCRFSGWSMNVGGDTSKP